MSDCKRVGGCLKITCSPETPCLCDEEMSDIKEILIGIDKTDSDCVTGWWETSKGAEFGAAVKKNLLTLHDKQQDEIKRLRELLKASSEYVEICSKMPAGKMLFDRARSLMVKIEALEVKRV